MKIMAIIGSMRNGNTKYLVEKMISEMRLTNEICIKKLHLKDITLHFCDGCLICDETGKCVIDDDMSKIVDEIRRADGFVFASPARWSLLSGEMKTFFDRLNPLAVREELRGKSCVNIVVGQSEEDDKESIILASNSMKAFCDNAGIKVIETVLVCGCYGDRDILEKNKYIEEGIKAGNKLLENLQK